MQAALRLLMDPQHGNPIVRDVLTCYERELRAHDHDAFPPDAGSGGMPIMTWSERELQQGGELPTASPVVSNRHRSSRVAGALQPTDTCHASNHVSPC